MPSSIPTSFEPASPALQEVMYEPTGRMSLDEVLSYAPQHFDYEWLDGNSAYRKNQKELFAHGEEYLPFYDYAKIRDRNASEYVDDIDQEETSSASEEIARLVDCIAVVQANRDIVGTDVADMYVKMFDVLIGRELLVQTAHRALTAGSAETRALWRHKFMEVNEVLYGEMDRGLFLGIMHTEARRLRRFEPVDEAGHKLKRELTPFFDSLETEGYQEPEFINQELIDTMMPLLDEEYAHIFAVIPTTDDSVVYDAHQVVEIMNKTLHAGGLAEKGWVAVVNPKKTIVSTNTATKTIEIPSNDTRTARQLKALVVHEQEVHARRGQNGLESKAPGLLGTGTANYGDVEEGLGIALECIVNGTAEGNVAVKRARDRYIHVGLALGIGSHKQRDARQVFELAWRIEALALAEKNGGAVTPDIIHEAKNGKWGATTHIENIFRGTDFAGKGIIYSKAKVYLEGFTKSVQSLKAIGYKEPRQRQLRAFRRLFMGKFDHTNAEEMHFARKMTQQVEP